MWQGKAIRTNRAAGFLRLLLLGGLLVIGIVMGGMAKAAAAGISAQGITVTPAVVNLDLPSGEPDAKVTIQVTNYTHTKQILVVSSLDFKSLNDTGGVAFIGTQANQVAYKYGLASWLTVGADSLDLGAGQSKEVSITIANRSDLTGGGHYAAVLFRTLENNDSPGKNHVALNEVVSSLIFVRKLDGARFGLALKHLETSGNIFHLPSTSEVVFQNTGNLQTTPRGVVTVTDPHGHEVQRGIVNADSNMVLPDGSRLFQTAMVRTGRAWWPGTYHVTLTYRYDGTSVVNKGSTYFVYVNPLSLLLLLVLLGGAGTAMYHRRELRRKIRRMHLERYPQKLSKIQLRKHR